MSNGDRLARPADMSQQDFDLIERFVTAFNRIDRFLRETYHADERMSFGRLVEIHLRKNPHWRDADALRSFKSVRNVIVHERDLPYRYLFVPTQNAVDEIEQVEQRMLSPERLLPRFRRNVVTVAAGDTAARLFEIIIQHGWAKLPVYEDGKFRGLLSEKSLAHWMARYVAAAGMKIDLSDVLVGTMLDEENGRNVEFMAAQATTDELIREFSLNPQLQAVLVTEHGKAEEKLLGIATWGDALQLVGQR